MGDGKWELKKENRKEIKKKGKIKELPVAGNNAPNPDIGFDKAVNEFRLNHSKKNREYLGIFDKDGYIVKYYEGEKDYVTYPGAATKGMGVVHNHPGNYGGTLSFEDVKNLIGCQQASVTATAKEGMYIMRPGEKAKPGKFLKQIQKDEDKLRDQMILATWKARAMGYNNDYVYKAQADVIHQYWKRTAKKYGFEYSFSGKGYSNKSRPKNSTRFPTEAPTKQPSSSRSVKRAKEWQSRMNNKDYQRIADIKNRMRNGAKSNIGKATPESTRKEFERLSKGTERWRKQQTKKGKKTTGTRKK